ncbi:MAG: MBL fold metallo-hydrolase, partial [Verrucomicrobia bacterium]|nr:MBL fold metallo-hydrolase [Verrucomicrobiota bacterium]
MKMLTGSLAAFAASLGLLTAETAPATLDIYWIDSEGGGSTLIVTPSRESILIDSGNPGGRDSQRIHHVAKDVAGLKRIDHLITTHLHIDHFGGAAELSQLMPIIALYDNGVPSKDPDGNKEDTRWP